MDYYMQLQEDRKNGLLSDEQYKAALKCFDWVAAAKHKNQEKKSTTNMEQTNVVSRPKRKPMDQTQRNIRNALRLVVKWLFDVELFRDVSPLFCGVDLNIVEFLKIANKCLDYLVVDKVIATVRDRQSLIENIKSLVKNRLVTLPFPHLCITRYKQLHQPPKTGRRMFAILGSQRNLNREKNQ